MSDETRDTENFDEKEMQNEAVAVETDGRDDGNGRGKPKTFFRKKVCRFCANKAKIDYKDSDGLHPVPLHRQDRRRLQQLQGRGLRHRF